MPGRPLRPPVDNEVGTDAQTFPISVPRMPVNNQCQLLLLAAVWAAMPLALIDSATTRWCLPSSAEPDCHGKNASQGCFGINIVFSLSQKP